MLVGLAIRRSCARMAVHRATARQQEQMKFKSEHRFGDLTMGQYEQLYFDEAFNIALCQAVGLHRVLVSRDDSGGRIRRVVRVAPERELPGAVAKLLGTTRLEYTETIDYTWGSGRGTWSTQMAVMTDKVDSRGTFGFVASGTAVTRIIEGDVTVRVPLIGGTIEKAVVSEVCTGYDKAAEFTRQWLLKNPR